MTTVRLAAWLDASPYIAVCTERIPKSAFGGLDQGARITCVPLTRSEAEELARAQEQDIQASPFLTGVQIQRPIVHPSIRHAFLEGLVFAVFGTGILWMGILGIIWAVRGLLSW